jgi:glycosyltransferase involved in cell wall biosynthesis
MISIVIPVLNEEAVLPELHRQLDAVLTQTDHSAEIIFVNDGSTDRTLDILRAFRTRDPRVKIVSLSRRFGHQVALTAGLTHAVGDAVIMMDADLQDEPAAILDFLKQWQAGHQVVYAIRRDRKESWLKRAAFNGFHRAISKLSSVHIPRDAGIFSLIDRRVVDVLVRMSERNRYLPGLRAWVGFRQVGVPVRRNARYQGDPRVSIAGLVSLAFDGLVSFSIVPLRIAALAGLVIASLSLAMALVLVVVRFTTDLRIPGVISILAVIMFFGGVQILCLGVVGEYVGRAYDEGKRRPLFVVDFTEGVQAAGDRGLGG